MNKTLIGIILLFLIGGVGYFILSGSETAEVATETGVEVTNEELSVSSSEEPVNLEEGLSSLKLLIERGEDLTCDFEHTSAEGVNSSGTIFISGENFRVRSMTSDATYGDIESGMIFKDEVVYAWSDGLEGELAGFTFPATQNDVIENSDGSGITDGRVTLEEEVDFSCTSWRVDESEFVPPSDIEFFDPSAMFMPPQ